MSLFKSIDYPVFTASSLILIALSLAIFFLGGTVDVEALKAGLTETVGPVFLTVGLLSLGYVLFIAFSKIGNIVLTGSADEAAELTQMQWIARLFCGGIGASILFWAATEWIFYLQAPPFNLAAGSREAVQWASTYGMFHWGPIAWAMYLVPTIPIAYVYHVRKVPVLKLSTALMPAIGEARAKGLLGKTIDTFFIVGVVAGGATGLGVKGPLMAEGFGEILSFTPSGESAIAAIVICSVVFLGLYLWNPIKGNSYLASFAFYGTFVIFAAFLIFGPAQFMFAQGLEGVGRILDNFFTMATYSQAADSRLGLEANHFPQDWTVFYWAWWLVFAPAMGLYLAKISQGRTIREVIIGTILFGSLGAFAFFSIIGNFGLNLYLTEVVNLPQILAETRPAAAVIAALQTMPMAVLVILVYVGVVAFYTAAGLESFSFMLGAVSQKQVGEEGVTLPVRIFWTVLLITLASFMIHIGGIAILQFVTIVCAVPMLFIMVLVAWAGWRIAWLDLRHQTPEDTAAIELTDFPEVDPWSKEGKALAHFEELCEKAAELSEKEQNMIDEMASRKRRLSLEDCDEETRSTLEKEIASLKAEYDEVVKQRTLLKYETDTLYAHYGELKAEREKKEAQKQREELKEAYLQDMSEEGLVQNKELQEKLAELKASQAVPLPGEEDKSEKADKEEKADKPAEDSAKEKPAS